MNELTSCANAECLGLTNITKNEEFVENGCEMSNALHIPDHRLDAALDGPEHCFSAGAKIGNRV